MGEYSWKAQRENKDVEKMPERFDQNCTGEEKSEMRCRRPKRAEKHNLQRLHAQLSRD